MQGLPHARHRSLAQPTHTEARRLLAQSLHLSIAIAGIAQLNTVAEPVSTPAVLKPPEPPAAEAVAPPAADPSNSDHSGSQSFSGDDSLDSTDSSDLSRLRLVTPLLTYSRLSLWSRCC